MRQAVCKQHYLQGRPDHQALLGVQYRMDPAISLFPNLESYAGKLADADAVVLRPVPPWRVDASEVWQGTAVRLIDTAGSGWEDEEEEDGASRLNPGEAKRVVAEARKLLEAGLDPSELGLITPYAGQARLLRQLLEDERVEIDSVDGFQGREKDVILLSLVRSNASGEIGFLKEKRRKVLSKALLYRTFSLCFKVSISCPYSLRE